MTSIGFVTRNLRRTCEDKVVQLVVALLYSHVSASVRHPGGQLHNDRQTRMPRVRPDLHYAAFSLALILDRAAKV